MTDGRWSAAGIAIAPQDPEWCAASSQRDHSGPTNTNAKSLSNPRYVFANNNFTFIFLYAYCCILIPFTKIYQDAQQKYCNYLYEFTGDNFKRKAHYYKRNVTTVLMH